MILLQQLNHIKRLGEDRNQIKTFDFGLWHDFSVECLARILQA